MTEEIIIDGVNVAGCFYFIDHTPPKGQGDWCGAIHKGACKVYSKACEYNKDCYYKQLIRLEQENKRYKQLLQGCSTDSDDCGFCEIDKRNKELEQENKELETDVLKWQKEFSRQYQINENKGYSKTEEKYRSALEEIREIVKPYLTDCQGSLCEPIDEVLKKINEVLK